MILNPSEIIRQAKEDGQKWDTGPTFNTDKDFDRDYIIETMKWTLGHKDPGNDSMWTPLLEESCRDCVHLQFDGCGDCQSCSSRWVGWQKRLLERKCPHFKNPIQHEGTMKVQFYGVVYDVPPNPEKRAVRVVAPSIKEALALLETAIPGMNVLEIPRGTAVDYVHPSISPEKVEVQPPPDMNPQPQVRR